MTDDGLWTDDGGGGCLVTIAATAFTFGALAFVGAIVTMLNDWVWG